jgi:hypothetical protein
LCIGSLETSIHINTLHHKEQDDGYTALTEIVCLAVVNLCMKHGRKFCYVCETLNIEPSSVIFSMFQLNCTCMQHIQNCNISFRLTTMMVQLKAGMMLHGKRICQIITLISQLHQVSFHDEICQFE